MYTNSSVEVNGSPMDVFVWTPEGDGPFPGVIAMQHIPVAHAGLEVDPFQIAVGERFAREGFVCAMPYVFHHWPREADITVKRAEFRDDWVVADMQAAYGVLADAPKVDNDNIGIIGHCWGGRLSWLGACHNSRLKACVVLYGGRIELTMGPVDTPPIAMADRIGGSVLGIFGNEDANPSPEHVNDLEAALVNAGVPYEFHRYDGAGHAFQDFNVPEKYRETQSEDAWDKMIAYLRRELGAMAAAR